MLLSITNGGRPATDLGYLLHKHPARCQEIELSFGKAYVFYPQADDEQCTACLLLDIDPVGIVRGKADSSQGGPLSQYVNDRPYVASSFLSVAIAKAFGSALQGKCKQRPDLVDAVLPLRMKLSAVPCRGGEAFLRRLFEPLGYQVAAKPHVLDPSFPDWGPGAYFDVELGKESALREVLRHLYVLIPVLDNAKHYYIDSAELEKLLAKGEGWLPDHPEKETITRRYLKHNRSLARQALARLMDEAQEEPEQSDPADHEMETLVEKPLSLREQRVKALLAKIAESGAHTVIDLGCGEGLLLKTLLRDPNLKKLAGMDVSIRSLEIAHKRIGLDRLPTMVKDRIALFHGSLMYKDKRLAGWDAAVASEVVEHLDPPRLAAFEKVVFQHARPGTVIITTPNREYNTVWETLPRGSLRHSDHRFEWTRPEFQEWGDRLAEEHGYSVAYFAIGPESAELGSPTQMGVFTSAD